MLTLRQQLAAALTREAETRDDPIAHRKAEMDVRKFYDALRKARSWVIGSAVVMHLEHGGGMTVDLPTVLEAYLANLSRYPKIEARERDAVIDLLPAPTPRATP